MFLKITFFMQSPICLAHPWINFDSLIAHLKLRRELGDRYRAMPSKKPDYKLFDRLNLPIEKFGSGGMWIYKCSVSIFDFREFYHAEIYKRFCEKYLNFEKLKRRKIQRGSGHFKDFMISHLYLPCRRVWFYVDGDKEEIEQLLDGLAGLGKKTAIGYGMIKKFKVEELDEDFSLVKDGKAMRPIPMKLCKFFSEALPLAYKFPYWAKRNVALCVPPGAEVELR